MMDEHSHRWSGWPGAYCLKCHAPDLMEMALGDNVYDPFTDVWTPEEAKSKYTNAPRPVSDERYREHMRQQGIEIPE